MENIKGLEEIKMRMRHMEEDLKEFHKLQLEVFTGIMSLSDIDEVDNEIVSVSDAANFKSFANEVREKEKYIFEMLMDLAWDIKCNEINKEKEEQLNRCMAKGC